MAPQARNKVIRQQKRADYVEKSVQRIPDVLLTLQASFYLESGGRACSFESAFRPPLTFSDAKHPIGSCYS